jgi:hypothetical protein
MKKMIIFMTLLMFFAVKLSAQVSLGLRVINQEKLRVLYLSDFDLLEQHLAEEIFAVQLGKTDNKRYDNAKMTVVILQDDEVIMTAESRPFTLPETFNPNPFEITNVEVINGSFQLNNQLESSRVEFNSPEFSEDKKTEIQGEALSTGTLPVGIYTIKITIKADGSNIHEGKNEFPFLVITNPSNIQLISPGSVYGSGDPSPIFSEFPIFQFTGDGEDYQISVYEKRNLQSSLEDILNSVPVWQSRKFSRDEVHEFSQYPQGSSSNSIGPVVPLEPGKTYCWMVNMYVLTSSGEEVKRSEVWQFKLMDPAAGDEGAREVMVSQLRAIFEQLFGDRAEDILNQLNGYDLKTITVNGSPMDIQEFIMQYSRGGFETSELEIW